MVRPQGGRVQGHGPPLRRWWRRVFQKGTFSKWPVPSLGTIGAFSNIPEPGAGGQSMVAERPQKVGTQLRAEDG